MKRGKKKKKFVVRPWSDGVCPTADELRAAWANRRRSQKDFILLLSVLGELTCFTDCTLEHRGGFGNIGGRRGGLKAFLAENAPELLDKYKSISRHARLAYRLKKAFSVYPPAKLELLHPEIPLPRINLPFITNFCRKLYRDHFADLPPRYKAFDDVVRAQAARQGEPKHPWGPPLPRSAWAEARRNWWKRVVTPMALEAIFNTPNWWEEREFIDSRPYEDYDDD